MPKILDIPAVKMGCASCGQMNRVPTERVGSGPKCGTCGDRLLTGKVAELDPKSLSAMSKGDDLPLLVDFWAPWCGPCRQMAPEFSKAAQAFSGKARFAKIDTQAHNKVSQKYGIRGIPALILFQGGREIARIAGARPARDIMKFVEDNGRFLA